MQYVIPTLWFLNNLVWFAYNSIWNDEAEAEGFRKGYEMGATNARTRTTV